MSKDDKEIDVLDEIKKSSPEQIDGARGGMDDGGFRRRTPGMRIFMVFIVLVAVAFGSVLTWKAIQHRNDANEKTNKPKIIKNNLPNFTPTPPPEPKSHPVEVPQPTPLPPKPDKDADKRHPKKSESDLLRERRLGGGFTGGGDSSGQPSSGSGDGPAALKGRHASDDNALEQQLKPLAVKPSRASMLADRNYMITRGTMIDCGQQSKLVTDQVGMVVCYTTSDTYSTNGHVVLLDAGSKVVGSYQKGIVQGQNRVFVSWQRVETPQGVIIDLDSPGTDPLGAAGEPGEVDTHFWQRFGNAILLSIIGDLGQAAVNYASEKSTINIGTTQSTGKDMSTEALKNTVNIPPTLYKNQGDRVSIFVARDLDFSDVYSIR